MQTLHICNANFESELIQKKELNFQSPVFKQLQFLPCLYAAPEDAYVASENPPSSILALGIPLPKRFNIEERDFGAYTLVESWGMSESVAEWAKKKHLNYPHPDFAVVREVNSKQFSFLNSTQLPGSALIENEEQLRSWLAAQKMPVVFKTCFGVSGKGHLILEQPDVQKALTFFNNENGRPLIAEPWVTRTLDFSTQWRISPVGKIAFIGATVCINNSKGQFRQNIVGEDIPHLEKLQKDALVILQKIAKRGYFGNVGIDAMLYTYEGTEHLHSIVEVNARKTMGFAAIELQKRYFPNEVLTLGFSPKMGFTFNINNR